tara:strand:+ start:494 stop:3439 length:2946 start_codon:yes stop_codon:yes gene_type:complete
MKIKSTLIIALLISLSFLNAMGTWIFNNRSHGELKWSTIQTKNFDVHYHNGIRDIALSGASMAEQIRPVLMKQMGLKDLPKLDIAFTTEDEVLNGFAVPANYTIIWVDQNDAALWNGDEKWLRTVLAHELQHLIFFNTVKGPKWLPDAMHSLLSGVPAWIVEGLAEYYTEKWRPFRYDISHKTHVINNTVHKIADPHNDGFSKSLYLADRFGDTTITKILNYRNKAGLLFFGNSFKKHTGIKLKQFNEDWRRQMNTFFFGQRAQKERLKDIGVVHQLPMKRVSTFAYSPDSMAIIMIGFLSKGQRDLSLVYAERDTLKEKKIRKKQLKKVNNKNEKPKKVKPQWKLTELDHGVFGEMIMNLDVSPDGSSIVYPKFRYGKNQSMVFDIFIIDIATKKKTLLTSSMRANYPKFSPNGEKVLFVAHKNSTSDLYVMDVNGHGIKKLTTNVFDTQIITPFWSPDGKKIVFAESGPDGNLDLYMMQIESGEKTQITDSREGDFLPIWHPSGNKISFTGLYDYTPNLFTYDIGSGKIIQNTNVGDAVMGMQWSNKTSTITAMTLPTVDSSRVISIDPKRNAPEILVNINPGYSSWRTKSPDYLLNGIDPNKNVKIENETSYSFRKNMSHLGSVVLPDYQSFLYNGVFTDALGRHNAGILYATDYDTVHSVYIAYQNYSGFPLKGVWGINLYNDANFQIQFLNKDQTFVEIFNGIALWGSFPYNFGRSLSKNHRIGFELQIVNRDFYLNNSLPQSSIFSEIDKGREGSIKCRYTFINKRVHKRNIFTPNQGYGLDISFQHSSSSIWGKFDYNKLRLDSYTNNKLGPFSIFGRIRFEALDGDPPNQESLGIYDIPNFYIMGVSTPGREYMSPRGYRKGDSEYYQGNRAYMGTLELRTPVLPISVFEALKVFKIGMPSFVLFSDFGSAWENNFNSENIIITSGAEIRLSFNLISEPIFIFSYGWAQDTENWFGDPHIPEPYLQLSLVNPF